MNLVTIEARPSAPAELNAVVRFDGRDEWPVRIIDPFAGDEAREELLAWYFEEHMRWPFLDGDTVALAVQALDAYGRDLFRQVFEADPHVYARYRTDTAAGYDGWQVEVVGPAEFQRLHWETLRDPQVPRPLAVEMPIVRRVSALGRAWRPGEAQSSTLNVLLVTARPLGARDVGYRTISGPLIERLRQARIRARVDLVRPGTFGALQDRLAEARAEHGSGWYQVVHFDVHGSVTTFDRLIEGVAADQYLYAGERFDGEQGFLWFEPMTGADKAQAVSAAEVAELLNAYRVPVAVLNACQSAKAGTASEASLAHQLSMAGLPLVVGMGWSVTLSAAERMMPTLYGELLDGRGPLAAVQRGRLAIYDDKSRRAYFDQHVDMEDWALPVVYQRSEVALRLREPTSAEDVVFHSEQTRRVDTPVCEYGFVGRDLDVLAVERRLLTGGVNELLVRGMAGTGKSTFLGHLASWWQVTGLVDRVFSFSYEHQAWTTQQIMSSIATGLWGPVDLDRFLALPDEAQREKLASALRGERHLLVLDNLESVTGTEMPIPHTLPLAEQAVLHTFLRRLHGGRTVVLFGSRSPEEWLAPGTFDGNVYDLAGLDPEAVSELVERILRRHDAIRWRGDEALGKLVEMLGGLPVPLMVILANLATTAPEKILSDLREGDPVLDPMAGDLEASKTASVLRCIEYSHANLAPDVQIALGWLAPFTGVVNRNILPVYCTALAEHGMTVPGSDADWQASLDAAISQGLADNHPTLPRHVVLQPVFPYYLRSAMADDPARQAAARAAFVDVYRRLAGNFLRLLTSRSPSERRTGQVAGAAEYANLVYAFEAALDTGVGVVDLLCVLDALLDQLHRHHEHLCYLKRAVASLESRLPRPLTELPMTYLNALGLLAMALLEQQHHGEAEINYRRALELLVEFDDRLGQAIAHHQLGRIAREKRRYDEAEANFHRALELFGDRARAATYHELGRVAEDQKRYDEAEANYRRAIDLGTESGDRHGQASSHHHLGIVAQAVGEHAVATANYHRAVELFIEFDDRHGQACTHGQLGSLAQALGQHAVATANYRRALELFIDLDDRHSQATAHHELGILAYDQGRFDEAEANYRRALDLFAEFDDPYDQMSTASNLGQLLTNIGRVTEAIPYSLEAFRLGGTNFNRWQLRRQRGVLGTDRFREIIVSLVGTDDANLVLDAIGAAPRRRPNGQSAE